MRKGCKGALLLIALAAPVHGQADRAPVRAPAAQGPAVLPAALPAPPLPAPLHGADNLPAWVKSLPARPLAPDPGPPPAAAPLPAIPLSPRETVLGERGPGKEVSAACIGEGATRGDYAAIIKACDVILSYPAYEDLFWPDRSSMLLRRGKLLLQLGLKDRAFESFDLANSRAAERGDPFWGVSGGMADRLLRVALRAGEPGGKAEAMQLARSLLDERAFSPTHLDRVHAFLAIGPRNPVALTDDYEREARIDPRRYVSLTHLYLMLGRFDAAARAAGQITLSEPHRREGWTMNNGQSPPDLLAARLNMFGLQAYAAAASGDSSGQAAYLAAARQQIGKFLDPIKLQTISGKESAERKRSEPRLREVVAEWEQAIRLRQDLAGKTVEDLRRDWATKKNNHHLLPVYSAMQAEIGRGEGENANRARLLAILDLDRTFFHRWNFNRAELEEMLPSVETRHSLGKIDHNPGMWFDGSLTGFSQVRDPVSRDDIRTVHYEAGESTRELAEELLAIAIARYARKDGYDGFVILSRHTIPRMVWMYGQQMTSGFDAQARVLMIRGGQLPAGSTLLAERIITVDEVDRALGPRFSRYAEYQARKRAEEKAGEELRKQAKKAAKD